MNKIVEQDISEDAPEVEESLPRRVRHGRIGWGMLGTLSLALIILTFLYLSLSGQTVLAPETVRARVEAGFNDRLGNSQVSVGSVDVSVGRDGIPRVALSDVAIGNPADGVVAVLNTLRGRLAPGRLLRGELAVSRLELEGAQITLRRTASGDFAVSAEAGGTDTARSVPDLLNLIDGVFESSALSSLNTVEAGGIVVSLEDARSGRIWQATNAKVVLRRAETGTTLSLVSDVFNGTDNIAGIEISIARNLTTQGVSLGVKVSDMPAADIALQSPVLAWLGVLDAPLSGSVRTEIGADGQMSSFAGTLDIGSGALQPAPDVPPVGFESARAYFTFDPSRERIDFTDIAVVSERGRLSATGQTYLAELTGPWPQAFLGQFTIATLDYDGEGVFEGPVSMADLRADVRLRLDPFTLEIGQLAVDQDEARIRATGRVTAGADGWHASVDAKAGMIDTERVLTYWPVIVSPITRGWLSQNLQAGFLENVSAGVRFQTGSKPDAILSFEFGEGTVSFLKHMPPLTGATGRASLVDKKFTLYLDEGDVDSGGEGILNAAGSMFTVPDTRPKPAMGEIDLVVDGKLTAALTVLNNPPLTIMDRAERSPDLAEADAVAKAHIVLPLKERILRDEVSYSVQADLRNVSSDKIATGRLLTADRLAFAATPDELRLDGPLRLDGVPVRAAWRQPLDEGAETGGWINGTVTLSDAAIKAFDIPLPEGLVGGQGVGRFRLELPRDGSPKLDLESDLVGMELSVGGIGWRKSASDAGGFELSAVLGNVPEVEGFSLSAPGLALDGQINLDDAGGFAEATFESIRVGDWLDGRVELTPRGADLSPAVRISEGRLDVRNLPDGSGEAGDGAPLDVTLDEVVVSDGIALTSVRGNFQNGRAGLSGTFTGRMNGRTPVEGTLAPANGGTAVRVQSADAGNAIKDAKLTPNAEGGTLDLVLTPVRNAPSGTYNGQFLVENMRLRKAPILADLLDAISVVGLIDQLAGPGILFSTVDGKFRLTGDQLVLTEAAAVGGSLGISADGIFDFAQDRLDFRGVISPVYFVNGIGAAVTRRGEGLFGFNYRMTGTPDDPKVGVNPLSILAPGMLRQIFRGRAPGE